MKVGDLSSGASKLANALKQLHLKWDAATDTIGIRPVPPNTVNAFQLYPTNRSGAYRFHAMRFLIKYDTRLEYTVRFPNAAIENGVLVLELATRVRSYRAVRPLLNADNRAVDEIPGEPATSDNRFGLGARFACGRQRIR